MMKIFVEGWWHHKNRNGIQLMINEGLDVDFQSNHLEKYDCIISLSEFKKYNHDGIILYGPHISLDIVLEKVSFLDSNCFINLLSDWNVNLANSIVNSNNYLALPFAVDVDKFTPKIKKGKPVLYFKQVDYDWLLSVKSGIKEEFIFFDYSNGYSENEFLDAISMAPFAIWIGRHESQGFAFQETLSCNTPLFVIDVSSMRDEVLSNQTRPWNNFKTENPLKATSASYFDNNCGLISNINNWKQDFEIFRERINYYSPREFIVKNLSPKSCVQLWTDNLYKIKNLI